MTATLDKTGDSWFHDLVLETFGLTPFVNTFPDFMAGGAVMITALFIAAGMEVIFARKLPQFSILKKDWPWQQNFFSFAGLLSKAGAS